MIESSIVVSITMPSDAQEPAPARAPAAPTRQAPPAAPAAPSEVLTEAPLEEVPAPGVVSINGKEYPIAGVPGGGDNSAGTGFPIPPDIPPNVYGLAKDGIIGFTLMIIAFPVFGFLKALVNRRAAAVSALPPRDVIDRLTRIEASVDAMATEVERISEGQRFVTKALSERSAVSR